MLEDGRKDWLPEQQRQRQRQQQGSSCGCGFDTPQAWRCRYDCGTAAQKDWVLALRASLRELARIRFMLRLAWGQRLLRVFRDLEHVKIGYTNFSTLALLHLSSQIAICCT